MDIVVDLILGTLATLGAALAGVVVAIALLPVLFILGQILFGWGEKEAPSGFALNVPDWYRRLQVILPAVLAFGPMIALLVFYPPSRIPFVVLLLLLVAFVVRARLQKKQT
jgi:hypothetical protein